MDGAHHLIKGRDSIKEKLRSIRENISHFKTVKDIAVLTNTVLYSLVSTDKIAFAVIDNNILRSVNVIGERVFLDLNLDNPSINGRAIKTRRTQLVNDTQIDPDYYPGEGPIGVKILSELCVPIIFEDDVLGTINLESTRLNNFSIRAAFLVESFSNEVARALSRLREEKGTITITQSSGVNRSSIEVYVDVLKVIADGETIKTKIFNLANVSWSTGTEILGKLESKGHVIVERLSSSRYVYRITGQGLSALSEYKRVKSIL